MHASSVMVEYGSFKIAFESLKMLSVEMLSLEMFTVPSVLPGYVYIVSSWLLLVAESLETFTVPPVLPGYAYIVSSWLLLVAESLEMFTIHLAWLSAVQLSSQHGRPVVEATLQAIVTVAHFGIGEH